MQQKRFKKILITKINEIFTLTKQFNVEKTILIMKTKK